MSRILNKILSKTNLFKNQENIIGKLSLSSFKFDTYLPHSSSSLDYSTLNHILNDVIINNRTSIIEFGSGISTIYIAKLAKMNGKDIKITSIDNDENWITIIKDVLEKEQISDYVEFIHTPLVKSELAIHSNKWFDDKVIKKQIQNKKYDLVIIDGPMAYLKEIRLSRYPALPFIKDYLLEKHVIILDDTNRIGEKKIIRLWENKYGYSFNKLSSSSRISYKGSHYNIV